MVLQHWASEFKRVRDKVSECEPTGGQTSKYECERVPASLSEFERVIEIFSSAR